MRAGGSGEDVIHRGATRKPLARFGLLYQHPGLELIASRKRLPADPDETLSATGFGSERGLGRHRPFEGSHSLWD